VTHEPLLAALFGALREVRAAPESTEARGRLATIEGVLARELGEHLELEERLIFPALERLDATTQLQILDELRARRR
jgi:hypothetical protein